MLKNIAKLACLFILFSNVAIAEEFEAGKDYEVLPAPVITHDKSKVEVVELFWYGCTHCFHFEPMLNAWKAKQADDVDFLRVPAMWNSSMQLHAKAFYTAKALGVLDKMHPVIFHAMNVEHNRLRTEDAIAELFAKQGLDAEAFSKTFNSFGVNSQVKLAESRAKSYRLQGTPEMVVNGKYRLSTSLTGSQEKMLKVADFLIAKERAALAK